MWYIDAKRLVDLCVEHGILQSYPKEGAVAVYCQAGNPPEEYPEGWYLIPLENAYHDIMDSEEGQKSLIAALEDIGVEFTLAQPGIEETSAMLQTLFPSGIAHFEERQSGDFFAKPERKEKENDT